MKTKKYLILATILVMAWSGCGLFEQWKEFKSGAGRFAVSMPGTPKLQELTFDTPAGKLTSYTYMLGKLNRSDTISYTVSYVDYPDSVFEKTSNDAMLDNGRQGLLFAIQGQLTSEERIAIKGYPGREIKAEVAAAKAFVQGRFYLVDKRLYQVIIFVPKKLSKTNNAERFLNSFRLL